MKGVLGLNFLFIFFLLRIKKHCKTQHSSVMFIYFVHRFVHLQTFTTFKVSYLSRSEGIHKICWVFIRDVALRVILLSPCMDL